MKKIQNILTATALVPVLLFSSCSNDFLDRTPETALDTDVVMNDPDMLPRTVVGTMGMIQSYAFNGRDLTVIGDLITDMVTSEINSGNGTLRDLENWNITTQTTDVSGLFSQGYGIAASAARTIEAAKRMLADSASLGLTSSQAASLNNAIAVSYVAKAYAEYNLAQYFCIDYNYKGSVGGRSQANRVGLMLLLDHALANDEPANMSTLEDTYDYIEYELTQAIDYFGRSGSNTTNLGANDARYYPSVPAAYTILARVQLARHKYAEALTSVDNAISSLADVGADQTLISDAEALRNAYGETPSTEDIWLMNYTSQDNLSANSLANLFGSYNFGPTPKAYELFGSNDIRRQLYGVETAPSQESDSRCLKYPVDNGVFNVPVLRVPELYLIRAEAAAFTGDLPTAQTALFAVLGARDTSLTDETNMVNSYGGSSAFSAPSVQNGEAQGILNTILEERAREFLCEGHRWFDLRRNGISLTRETGSESNDYAFCFENYPINAVSYPIPYSEFTTQQWIDGRGILSYNDDWTVATYDQSSGDNWQTDAWNSGTRPNYQAAVTMPADMPEGTDFNHSNN